MRYSCDTTCDYGMVPDADGNWVPAEELDSLQRELAAAHHEIDRLRMELNERPECVAITCTHPALTVNRFDLLPKDERLQIEIKAKGKTWRFKAVELVADV